MNSRCNPSFVSKFAICDGQTISADAYGRGDVKCIAADHPLELAVDNFYGAHFVHKNKSDTDGAPITRWHSQWQGYFQDIEVPHPRMLGSVKNRIADVLVGNWVLEIQHSPITAEEVAARNSDYALHDRRVIWLLDGGAGVNINQRVPPNGTNIIEFGELDMYTHFTSCEMVFVDYQGAIYGFTPQLVKSHMAEAIRIEKRDFIDMVTNNDEQLWQKPISDVTKIYIKQQGAGNGKTYGIIQQLDSDEFAQYSHFIMMSKQHSAKSIMKNEFESQLRNNLLKNITNVNKSEYAKKYIINYNHKKDGQNKNLIISTIDAFVYSIGTIKTTATDLFMGLVRSIIDGDADEKTSLRYAGVDMSFDSKLCLIIDEAQDLHDSYGAAIFRLCKVRGIHAYIVGDKLQSIAFNPNAFTYMLETDLPNVEKIKYDETNICRRFNDPALVDMVNTAVKFDQYNLPQVTATGGVKNEGAVNIEVLELGPPMKYYENIDIVTEKVMEVYRNEVDKFNREPEDFLIICPHVSSNRACIQINLAINTYWQNGPGRDKFRPYYSVFHRSEEGTSINLDESKDATRIVSIHTAKGDGRKVVILFDFEESRLRSFDKFSKENGIIYESLLHVALTRMKEKIYIFLHNKADDIYQRLSAVADLKKRSILPINCRNKTKTLAQSVDNDLFEEIKKCAKFDYLCPADESSTQVIDMAYHTIRYIIMRMIVNRELHKNSPIDSQLRIVSNNIVARDIIELEADGNICRGAKHDCKCSKCICRHYWKIMRDDSEPIPMLKTSNRNDVDTYYRIIVNTARRVIINSRDIHHEFCPYELVVLGYLFEAHSSRSKGNSRTDIAMMDLYSITHMYAAAFNTVNLKSAGDIHKNYKCSCQKDFNKLDTPSGNIHMCEFIVKFFEEIKIFKMNIQPFVEHCKNKNICPSKGESIGKKLKISARFDIMQKPTNKNCDKDRVGQISVAVIKPKINAMNYLSIISETLINVRLLKKQYKNAKILVWFITLTHSTKPIEVEINQEDKLRDIIIDLACNQLTHVGKSIEGFIKMRISDNPSILVTEIRDELRKLLKTDESKQNKITRKFTINVLQTVGDRIRKASKITDDILNDAIDIVIKEQKEKLKNIF